MLEHTEGGWEGREGRMCAIPCGVTVLDIPKKLKKYIYILTDSNNETGQEARERHTFMSASLRGLICSLC